MVMTTKMMSHIKFTTKDSFDYRFLEAAMAAYKRFLTGVDWYIAKTDENVFYDNLHLPRHRQNN